MSTMYYNVCAAAMKHTRYSLPRANRPRTLLMPSEIPMEIETSMEIDVSVILMNNHSHVYEKFSASRYSSVYQFSLLFSLLSRCAVETYFPHIKISLGPFCTEGIIFLD